MKPRNVGCSLVTWLSCVSKVPFWRDWSGWIVAVTIFIFSEWTLTTSGLWILMSISRYTVSICWFYLDDSYGSHWLWDQGPKEKRIKGTNLKHSETQFQAFQTTMPPLDHDAYECHILTSFHLSCRWPQAVGLGVLVHVPMATCQKKWAWSPLG